jgi:hypothetical protein
MYIRGFDQTVGDRVLLLIPMDVFHRCAGELPRTKSLLLKTLRRLNRLSRGEIVEHPFGTVVEKRFWFSIAVWILARINCCQSAKSLIEP